MTHILDDIAAALDGADSTSEHIKPVSVSKKLFSRRQLPPLDTDDELYGASPTAGDATLMDFVTGSNTRSKFDDDNEPIQLGVSDDDRLRTMVISSSEDETDHLERVTQAFSSQPSPTTPTTPPPSRPRSSRRVRRRRVISSQTSESNIEAPTKSRPTESPAKHRRSDKKLKMGPNIAIAESADPAESQNKRLTRSSTISQRQKKVPGNPQEKEKGSASESDEARPKMRGRSARKALHVSDDEARDANGGMNSGLRANKTQDVPAPLLIPDSSDASGEEIVTPARKRRLARTSATSQKAQSEDAISQTAEDLQEDIDDLKDTELRSHRTRATNRTPKKTKAQQQLELLRRRRAGQRTADASSELDDISKSPSMHKAPHNWATASSEAEASDELEQDDDSNPILEQQGEDLDQYDDDFVVDDDSEALGVPHELSEIPLEFTRHAHKKPYEHFKDAVEWMVHNKLNPAFPRDDPIYQIAVQKLDDEVRGLAGSKFMSAAWGAEFLNILKQKPEIAYVDARGLFEQHCAACNKSNHPAKFQLIFSGKSYNRQSLEDISDDDEEDATEVQDGVSGHERTFYVGRTCCANAETAHALHHWRYALNHWVLEWLMRRGHTSAEKTLERERMSAKKRSQCANDVVDGMEASGEMRTLYKEFKENLEAARDAKVGAVYPYSGETTNSIIRLRNTPTDAGRHDAIKTLKAVRQEV